MPGKVPLCPNCGEPLSRVNRERSIQLEWDGEKWIEKDVFSDQTGCPKCYEEAGEELFDDAGMALP